MATRSVKRIANKIKRRTRSLPSPPMLRRSRRIYNIRSSSRQRSQHKKWITKLNKDHAKFFSELKKDKSAESKVNVLKKLNKLHKHTCRTIRTYLN